MANYHPIASRFWADVDVRGWSDQAKLLALYLLTCRHRSLEGIYLLPPEYAGADLKWPVEKVTQSLGQLQDAGFVSVDAEAQVVLVRNALKYQPPRGEKQVAGALSVISQLPETPLLSEFISIARMLCPELASLLQKRYPATAPNAGRGIDGVSAPPPCAPDTPSRDTPSIGDPGLEPPLTTSTSTSTSRVTNDVEPDRLDQARAQRDAEDTVFSTWVQATGRTSGTVFDDKRRRVVRRALAEAEKAHMPLDDVLDAVRGVRLSGHHMGNRQYSELKVVLRDIAQIEHFRDLERTHTSAGHTNPGFLAEHPCSEDDALIAEWERLVAELPDGVATFLAKSHPHRTDDGAWLIGVQGPLLSWLRSRASNPKWVDALFGGRRVEFIECPLIERNAA